MSRRISALLAALILATILTACMGGDDEPTATAAIGAVAATPTETPTAPATETVTTGGSDAASPTAGVSPTATPRATAPSRPVASPTSQPVAATETPTGSSVTEDEATLLTALILPEDLDGDWVQDTFGPMEPDTDDGDELCGQPPFPDRDQRLAGVEAEYSRDTADPAFVLHNIVAFPEETAVAALEYAREISSCGEWTDDEGQTYTITPLAEPDLGDEAYAAVMTFEVQGTPFYGEYTFIRAGGLIATIAFITIEGSEVSDLQGLPALAAARLDEIAGGSEPVDPQQALLELVLLPEEIEQVDDVNTWSDDDLTDTDDPERY
ncbi:MAG: hypothetical protein ACRD1H_20880, partial [Vicinamibacterales bacterium]